MQATVYENTGSPESSHYTSMDMRHQSPSAYPTRPTIDPYAAVPAPQVHSPLPSIGSSTGTPAVTPPSSTMSYTSGHSPSAFLGWAVTNLASQLHLGYLPQPPGSGSPSAEHLRIGLELHQHRAPSVRRCAPERQRGRSRQREFRRRHHPESWRCSLHRQLALRRLRNWRTARDVRQLDSQHASARDAPQALSRSASRSRDYEEVENANRMDPMVLDTEKPPDVQKPLPPSLP